MKYRNSTLANLPGDHLSLTRAVLQVMGHSARRALTVEFSPRAETLTLRRRVRLPRGRSLCRSRTPGFARVSQHDPKEPILFLMKPKFQCIDRC